MEDKQELSLTEILKERGEELWAELLELNDDSGKLNDEQLKILCTLIGIVEVIGNVPQISPWFWDGYIHEKHRRHYL